jgi:Na+/H+-translocating membrane pyrophosphatase
MFITGLGQSPELPIVLALLSVAGVLLGILLRVRAFLLLGVTFLFLVVFSQIWYAAVDRAQTWVWWVSGIVLGVAILTLFALFEKRRNDVLKMIDTIKGWR